MKVYFRLNIILYLAALVVCLWCRVTLKLEYIDFETGFYTGGDYFARIMNYTLLGAAVILLLGNRLKKTGGDYPVMKKGAAINVLAVICGLAMLAFAVSGAPEITLEQGRSPVFGEIGRYLGMALGVLSGVSFVAAGGIGVLFNRRTPPGLLMAAPVIWQAVLLITRYNGYTTVLSISDHMLVVMFMLFDAMFLLGHARTVCGFMRRDGRNYAIPSGLLTSLFGFVLTVPGFVDLFLYGGADMPPREIFLGAAAMPGTPLIGIAESVFIFIMSVYALCFAISLMRSIKRV